MRGGGGRLLKNAWRLVTVTDTDAFDTGATNSAVCLILGPAASSVTRRTRDADDSVGDSAQTTATRSRNSRRVLDLQPLRRSARIAAAGVDPPREFASFGV